MASAAPALRAAALGSAFVIAAVLVPAANHRVGAQEAAPVSYRPPVDAPVIDTFRPPASPFGPGNRGIDYATRPGMPVRVAGPGVVAFAGPVAGSLHVVVLHADGIRTSYSFLRDVAVRRGERLVAGQSLGTASRSLHFGARAGDAYVDPLVLMATPGVGRRVHLVPDDERRLRSEHHERRGIERLLAALPGTGMRVAGAAVAWARQAPAAVSSVAAASEEMLVRLAALAPPLGAPWLQLASTSKAWWDRRATCTDPNVQPPPPTGRRLAVLVAGLGSSSEHAAVYNVDTAALGYAPGDVGRFSYRGGTTAEHPYDQADTQGDIAIAGRRLRALLERLQASHPGVPIDVIAHSQGGVVTRSALGQRAPPTVGQVITLGTPHQGADLATALALLSYTPRGALVQAVAGRLRIGGIDPRSRSVRQLAETSRFLRRLNGRPLPEGVRFTSIAARADVIVATPRTALPGATQVVVSVGALNAHSALPGSGAATREMALARAGMAPTCESLADALADAVVGQVVSTTEDLGGLALVAAG